MNRSNDMITWLRGMWDVTKRDVTKWRHVTADLDVDSEVYACPASRTEPLGDLPWGEEHCTCGLTQRKRSVLARVEAERAILEYALMPGETGDLDEYVVQWIAYGHRHDAEGWREEWAPTW